MNHASLGHAYANGLFPSRQVTNQLVARSHTVEETRAGEDDMLVRENANHVAGRWG